jgi:hypothetical protein
LNREQKACALENTLPGVTKHGAPKTITYKNFLSLEDMLRIIG